MASATTGETRVARRDGGIDAMTVRAAVETTTPTGHTYRSQAPPVLTIQDYPARPDYVLAG